MSDPSVAYYTTLLQRRLARDPTLTDLERRELDLHILSCPRCAYTLAVVGSAREPERTADILHTLAHRLTPAQVAPYLEELAEALQRSHALTDFQRWLWDYVRHTPAVLAEVRLLQARLAHRARNR